MTEKTVAVRGTFEPWYCRINIPKEAQTREQREARLSRIYQNIAATPSKPLLALPEKGRAAS